MNNEQNHLLIDDHSELDRVIRQVLEEISVGEQPLAFILLDYFWARLAMHIRAEHLHLFPTLLRAVPSGGPQEKAAESSSIATVIEQLRSDHDFFMSELAGAIKIMRKELEENSVISPLNLEDVRKRIEYVGRRLLHHNELEESRVYPFIDLLLPKDEAHELHLRMKRELDNAPARLADNSAS